MELSAKFKQMYFTKSVTIRINEDLEKLISVLQDKNPEVYSDISMVFRIAIMRLFRQEMAKKYQKCAICGKFLTENEHFFGIGAVCHGCFLAADAEKIKEWGLEC